VTPFSIFALAFPAASEIEDLAHGSAQPVARKRAKQ
jgi:hypothetical protein